MGSTIPPDRIELGEVGAVLRRYRPDDLGRLYPVIEASRDHLRPWMPWADQDEATAAAFLTGAVDRWARSLDFNYTIVDSADGRVLGGAGMHRRGAADDIEIGYWRAVDSGGRGIVTAAARALTTAALALHGIRRVEIRCDEANAASAAIPHRLGYRLERVDEVEILAAAETGRHLVWGYRPDDNDRRPGDERLDPEHERGSERVLLLTRPIQPEDADAVVALYSDVAGEGRWIGGELPLSDEKVVSLRNSAAVSDERAATFVAVVDDRLVGWAWVGLESYGRTGIGMAVAADYRGRGVGRALLDRVIRWSARRGAHKVDLEVWPHNTVAIALYERAGFQVEGHRRRHWRRNDGSLWDSVEMGLVLDHTASGSDTGDSQS
ncbi:hypothetical protein BH24ACT5_BH24ACT5_05890 [soil metagenome]